MNRKKGMNDAKGNGQGPKQEKGRGKKITNLQGANMFSPNHACIYYGAAYNFAE